jgi:hypothetical protein
MATEPDEPQPPHKPSINVSVVRNNGGSAFVAEVNKLFGHWRADSASDDRDIEIVEDGGELRAAVQQERRRSRLQLHYRARVERDAALFV